MGQEISKKYLPEALAKEIAKKKKKLTKKKKKILLIENEDNNLYLQKL
jgi:hypothetical protein